MPCFVNLPLSYIHDYPQYLTMFCQRGIAPELGVDTRAVQELSLQWHKETANRLSDAGLVCSVHLPFFDLHPASLNHTIRTASKDVLVKGMEIAMLYAPCHCVGHPAYDATQHAACLDEWIANGCNTWRPVMDVAGGTSLYLENTYEAVPEPVALLAAALDAGICFDIGHWFSFGNGSREQNLEHWVRTFASHLSHLHLHDNDGSGDQHLGLGAGSIPLDMLWQLLQKYQVQPTVTLEPHEEESFEVSTRYLTQHPELGDVLQLR